MNIFVNATGAEIGGLYTIVDQFLMEIRNHDIRKQYYVFVSNNKFDRHQSENVKIIKVDAKKWHKRFIWDAYGMRKWVRANFIYPDKIISLQNTPVKFNKKIPQLIYLHTSIPFVPYNWNIRSKTERKMWFYKNIYPFFIKLFLNRNCEIIVQANWLQKAVSSFLEVPKERIHVIRPNVNISIDEFKGYTIENSKKKKVYFYPAIDYIYKNHIALLQALELIKEQDHRAYKDIKLIFTVGKESWIYKEACKLGVEGCIEFIGQVDFKDVLRYYSSSDVILFPSYIETFGLPLIEAAYFNKTIICADEEYAREVLATYNGVDYVPSKNIEGWVEAILSSFYKSGDSYNFKYEVKEDPWKNFFDVVCYGEGK